MPDGRQEECLDCRTEGCSFITHPRNHRKHRAKRSEGTYVHKAHGMLSGPTGHMKTNALSPGHRLSHCKPKLGSSLSPGLCKYKMITASLGESVKPHPLFLTQELGFDRSDDRTTGKAGWEATAAHAVCQGALNCHCDHVIPIPSPLSQAEAPVLCAIPPRPPHTS